MEDMRLVNEFTRHDAAPATRRRAFLTAAAAAALGPAAAHLISAPVIWGFPLDEARHADIRRQIEGREALALVPAE